MMGYDFSATTFHTVFSEVMVSILNLIMKIRHIFIHFIIFLLLLALQISFTTFIFSQVINIKVSFEMGAGHKF